MNGSPVASDGMSWEMIVYAGVSSRENLLMLFLLTLRKLER